jgi:hypothetical protein
MGDFYSAGRLVSREARKIVGKRTLIGATREDIWPGTALARPIPGGVQVEVISSSAADDAARPDVWDVTVGGLTDANDIARISIGGIAYRARVTGGWTTDDVAEALRSAIASGSVESWVLTPTANAAAGDTYRVTLGAVNYDFVAAGGETVAQICTGIAGALVGNPLYTATATPTFVGLTALFPGVSADPSVSVPVDPDGNSTLTATQSIAGVAANTTCTPVRVGSVITLTSVTAGPSGILTVTSGYDFDPDVDGTVTAVHTFTGAAGTGVRSVRLDYLDANGVPQTETIATNGTTAALSTATDIEQLLAVTTASVGSSGAAVGDIAIQGVGGGTIYAQIDATTNDELAADYTVRSGRVAYARDLFWSASAASEIQLMSDTNPASGAIVSGASFVWATIYAGAQSGHINPGVPWGPFPAGARVWIAATGAAGRVIEAQADVYTVTL